MRGGETKYYRSCPNSKGQNSRCPTTFVNPTCDFFGGCIGALNRAQANWTANGGPTNLPTSLSRVCRSGIPYGTVDCFMVLLGSGPSPALVSRLRIMEWCDSSDVPLMKVPDPA